MLTTIKTYLEENPNHSIRDIYSTDLDWPLRIFNLLQRIQEGDAISEVDLKRELELWNRSG